MAKQVKDKNIEETLWDSANRLRGSVETFEYKHVVLGLIFLKFASDKFEDHRKKMINEDREKYIEMAPFYNEKSIFFLEEISRLNMVSKLSENGVAGFILANGALSGGGEEYKIRRKLIENNLV